jgi:hypothetical protein
VYGWTEPHACAGHAVAIRKGSSCLQCQLSALGESKWTLTSWQNSPDRHQEPGCGAIYQPYGPVEITWTTCLVSSLSLDCLLGKIPESTHRIWAAPYSLLKDAGGRWTSEWICETADREKGGFIEERSWPKNPACPTCC